RTHGHIRDTADPVRTSYLRSSWSRCALERLKRGNRSSANSSVRHWHLVPVPECPVGGVGCRGVVGPVPLPLWMSACLSDDDSTAPVGGVQSFSYPCHPWVQR